MNFFIPDASSLKDKRQISRSIIDRVKHRFNVSIAEIDTQDILQTLTIGFSIVSGDLSHLKKSIDTVIIYIEENILAELVDVVAQDYSID